MSYYLVALSIYFAILSSDKNDRLTCLSLFVITALEAVIRHGIDWSSQWLYYGKAGLMWLGAFWLIRIASAAAIYQASILCATSAVYLWLVYDTFATNQFGWIYDNFEAIIYGLVGCQLVGTVGALRRLPSTLRACVLVLCSAGRYSFESSSKDKGETA